MALQHGERQWQRQQQRPRRVQRAVLAAHGQQFAGAACRPRCSLGIAFTRHAPTRPLPITGTFSPRRLAPPQLPIGIVDRPIVAREKFLVLVAGGELRVKTHANDRQDPSKSALASMVLDAVKAMLIAAA